MRKVIFVAALAIAISCALNTGQKETVKLQKDFEEMRAAANGTTL